MRACQLLWHASPCVRPSSTAPPSPPVLGSINIPFLASVLLFSTQAWSLRVSLRTCRPIVSALGSAALAGLSLAGPPSPAHTPGRGLAACSARFLPCPRVFRLLHFHGLLAHPLAAATHLESTHHLHSTLTPCSRAAWKRSVAVCLSVRECPPSCKAPFLVSFPVGRSAHLRTSSRCTHSPAVQLFPPHTIHRSHSQQSIPQCLLAQRNNSAQSFDRATVVNTW